MFRSVCFFFSTMVCVQFAAAQAKPSPFYLSEHLKASFIHMNLDELEAAWPAFQHRPFNESGFSHLVLPFHYEDRSNDGHPNEALSFSFLMSNSLDWSPGCYCSRHAFFVFSRDKKRMQNLTKKYNTNLIAKLVTYWDATHAVGGKLIRSKEGYSGVLQIFDKKGNQVLHKEYDTPRPYFTLLGEMATDAMALLDVPPSKELTKYLSMKRCKDPQSLIKLGEAAFDCDRMSVYQDILHYDPDFADARYWWALRKSWIDGDNSFHQFQYGQALKSYLVEAALVCFNPKVCPNKEFSNEFPQWLSKAEELVGPYHPSFVRLQLRNNNLGKKSDLVLLQRGLKAAQQYPNSYYLLMELYRAYGSPPVGYDDDMLISLCIAMMRSNFMTGSSSQYTDNIKPLCVALHILGHPSAARDILTPLCETDLRQKGMKVGDSWATGWLAEMCYETGQFDEAIKWHRVTYKRMNPSQPRRKIVLGEAAVTAALAGKPDVIEQILRDRRYELDQLEITPVIEAYRDVLAGRDVDLDAIANMKFKLREEWRVRQQTLFLAQMDLKNGTRNYRKQFIGTILCWPLSRQMWAIFDGYERQTPSEAGCGFYHALEWLYPDDPWVKQAVADYRKRTPEEKQKEFVPIETLMALLEPFPPQRYPQDVKKFQKYPPAFKYSYADYAYGIKRLIDKRDFAKAREMALRFNTMLAGSNFFNLRYMANHLIHKVEEAEKKAKPRIFALR